MLTLPERAQLLAVAGQAIRVGLRRTALRVRIDAYPAALQQRRATFVTLYLDGQLRGCMGNLDAECALIESVARNAHIAAFDDPRFPPLAQSEFDRLAIELSILSAPESIHFSSEAELLAQLRPHQDGLVLEEHRSRATFLPAVWKQIEEPAEFLRHLKCKAGLPAEYWSSTLAIKRYVVESIP